MEEDYIKKISVFIEENDVDCELRVFEGSCHSVQEACLMTNATPEEFIKSVCFISKDDLIVGIVKGNNRASSKRIGKLLERNDVRMADADEVLLKAGFPIGGVPPIGYSAIFFIDDRVIEDDMVWAGGGTDRSLIKISPNEIKRITSGKVNRIRK